MQEMTWGTMLAVLEEMFGPLLFWLLVVGAVVVTVAYLYVLLRDRAFSVRKFLWAQVSMPLGALIAVWLVFYSTDSGWVDLGGPVDYLVLLGIALLGAFGAAILVYTLQSLLWPPKAQQSKAAAQA